MVICKVTTQAKRSANFSPWWQHHWCKVPHCFLQTIQLQCEYLVFLTQRYIRLESRMGYNTWKWRCLSWLVHLKWESKVLAIEVDLLCDSPSPIWKGFRSNIGTIPLSTNTKAFPPSGSGSAQSQVGRDTSRPPRAHPLLPATESSPRPPTNNSMIRRIDVGLNGELWKVFHCTGSFQILC